MALTLSCAPAIVTFLYDETQRTRALSLYGSMTAMASVAAPLIGGVMIAWMDWPGVYWFRVPIAIIALALLPLLNQQLTANLRHRSVATAQTKPSTLRLLFQTCRRDQRFLWINIVSAVLQLSTFSVPLLVPYYLSTIAVWPSQQIGIVLGSWAIGTLLGSMLTGVVSKRWRSNVIACAAAWLCTCGLLCVMFWSETPNWSLIFFRWRTQTGLLRAFLVKRVASQAASPFLPARWVWYRAQCFGSGCYNWQSLRLPPRLCFRRKYSSAAFKTFFYAPLG